MEDYSYHLIVAYFEKTISDEGLSELGEWLDKHPDHQEQFRETIQILEATKLYFGNVSQTSSSWQKISSHIKNTPKEIVLPAKKVNWLAYAATLVLLSGIAFLFYNQNFKKQVSPVAYAEMQNPEGQQSKILLPDSSVVYLAGGSKIRFEKKFNGRSRSVDLDGEAFFNVRHRKKPFVIRSGNISTVVLGTSFNVKAFESDHKVTVTVNTGKVGVLKHEKGKNILMKYLLPNDQLEVNMITGQASYSHVNAENTSAWINNHFIFSDRPLYDVLASLEHRYGLKIKLMDQSHGNIRITAKFRNMPLEQVMQELMTLSGLSYTKRKDQVFIYEMNQKGGKKME